MAREIIQRIWCDPCMAEDVRSEATYFTVALGNRKPREIAFCGTHYEEILQPLEQAIDELGQVIDSAAAPTPASAAGATFSAPVMCLAPGCGKSYKQLKRFRDHARMIHELTAREYDRRFAAPDTERHRELEQAAALSMDGTLLEQEESAEDLLLHCPAPDCDVVYDPADYKRPMQALSSHKRMAHPDVDFSIAS
jgi:hypothetical protein